MNNGTDKSIGRLEGKMDLVLDGMRALNTKVDNLEVRGCVQGTNNAEKIEKLEKSVENVKAGRLSGKELLKVLGGATGITAIITSVVEIIRHGSK